MNPNATILQIVIIYFVLFFFFFFRNMLVSCPPFVIVLQSVRKKVS